MCNLQEKERKKIITMELKRNNGFGWQVFQVAPSLFMVEVRKSGGDTLEFHKVLSNCEIAFSCY